MSLFFNKLYSSLYFLYRSYGGFVLVVCINLKAMVASYPTYSIMTSSPPGCLVRYSVTSYTYNTHSFWEKESCTIFFHGGGAGCITCTSSFYRSGTAVKQGIQNNFFFSFVHEIFRFYELINLSGIR